MLQTLYAILQTLGIDPYSVGHPLTLTGRAPGWTTLRRRYLASNPVCIITGSRTDLDVHHIRPVSLFPSLELAWDNLVTLRRDMHLIVGHCGNWSLWNEDFEECAEALAAAWRKAKEGKP